MKEVSYLASLGSQKQLLPPPAGPPTAVTPADSCRAWLAVSAVIINSFESVLMTEIRQTTWHAGYLRQNFFCYEHAKYCWCTCFMFRVGRRSKRKWPALKEKQHFQFLKIAQIQNWVIRIRYWVNACLKCAWAFFSSSHTNSIRDGFNV